MTVLKALQTLNILLILVSLSNFPALADFKDFNVVKIEKSMDDNIEIIIIAKSNLFQPSSQYFSIPYPTDFTTASKM